jgi:hypothetical protein
VIELGEFYSFLGVDWVTERGKEIKTRRMTNRRRRKKKFSADLIELGLKTKASGYV